MRDPSVVVSFDRGVAGSPPQIGVLDESSIKEEKDGPGQNAALEQELPGLAKITGTDGGLVEQIAYLVENEQVAKLAQS